MFGEKRQSKRYSINRVAKFVTESGALPRDCIVTDISEGGARLFSEAANIPDQFRLLIDGDTPIREECRGRDRSGVHYPGKRARAA
jgi:PilZ domain